MFDTCKLSTDSDIGPPRMRALGITDAPLRLVHNNTNMCSISRRHATAPCHDYWRGTTKHPRQPRPESPFSALPFWQAKFAVNGPPDNLDLDSAGQRVIHGPTTERGNHMIGGPGSRVGLAQRVHHPSPELGSPHIRTVCRQRCQSPQRG